MKRAMILACMALLLPGCLSAQSTEDAAAKHFYWRPASDEDKPRPWAILLPGGGGIDVFGDEGQHYFDFADRLNSWGYDVLLVHYQEAAKFLPSMEGELTGSQIATIVDYAAAYERTLGRLDMRCDGLVFGWSYGGLGVWELAERDRTALPGLAYAFAYYPLSVGIEAEYRATIPITILQGADDQLTPLATLQGVAGSSQTPEALDIHVFDGAQHGFDIETLDGPQLEGRFEHQAEADRAADQIVLERAGPGSFGCALD